MKKKYEVWLPLLFSLVLIAGMFVGYRFSRSQPNTGFFTTTKGSSLQEALDIIRLKYVDSLKIDTLQSNAIREMMNELDPHSVYLPPVDVKETQEDLSGKFQGIGVEFNLIRDTVNITYVINGGPSEKAGLQIGDQIIKVDGQPLTGKDMTTTTIRNLIRGESGTKANLDILREGKTLPIEVIRGSIPTPSIVASYMVDTTIGYIKLDKFTSTSYREFMEKTEALKKQGMASLIFGLRGNGGGYMDQAIDIADEFLDGDKLVVYTQGTNSPKKEYRCKRPGIFEKGKVTVLVDELSASASEIVAGALQDWDRATIIGRRTFGKGLVQEMFPLSDGAALKLTVSRYYTPLGRSIQRPYDKGRKVYMDEVWNRFANGEAYFADSNKVSNGKQYKTPTGRILYGGGGIMPDIFVGLDTSKYSREIHKIFFSGSFNDFVFHYYLDNKSILAPYKTPAEYAKDFEPSTSMWSQFVVWAKRDTVNLSGVPALDKQRVEDRMEAALARFKWRDNGFYQVLNAKDPAVLKAIEVLTK
ncbi:MAG: carboxyl-terminal protease [Sphingobacteriales bacterium 41-5]|nr:MAG: carboxyl-terminal protease [Sphingobacteriales bacterium 41-5]